MKDTNALDVRRQTFEHCTRTTRTRQLTERQEKTRRRSRTTILSTTLFGAEGTRRRVANNPENSKRFRRSADGRSRVTNVLRTLERRSFFPFGRERGDEMNERDLKRALKTTAVNSEIDGSERNAAETCSSSGRRKPAREYVSPDAY